jgi:benzoyl-CoA-dihydrodiol lyase
VFCSGANIFMLGVSSHAWKVNFCKFTNETRNGIEDSAQHSGLKFLAAVNGACAGGGYELALACDEIILVDDRSSAVSLPEVPLLGVLPGTGGLTRVTDKRKVRHDLADIFCTTTEGVRGQKAKDWRLVDDIAKPPQFAAKVQERALELAAQSDRPAGAKGVALTPLQRTIEADALRYPHVDVEIDRAKRTATFTVKAPPARSRRRRRIEAAGAAWYPLAMARELDDAILEMRTNELEIGTWLIKTEGDAAAVLAMDATLAAHATTGSCARPSACCAAPSAAWTCQSRSLFALIEPGSCFAGSCSSWRWPATAATCWRCPTTRARPKITRGRANFGSYPMATGQSRLGAASTTSAGRSAAVRAKASASARRRRRLRAGPGHQQPRRHRLGRRVRIAIEERVAMSPDALTGMEANLRFNGPETCSPRLRPPHRLAELDLPAPQRRRREGRAQGLRQGRQGRLRLEPR